MAQKKEVSGLEVSLQQAVASGLLEKPELQSFNDWQQWRKKTRSRPTKAQDDVSRTTQEEANLWRETMEHFYGSDWNTALAMKTAVGDDDDEEDSPDTPRHRVGGRDVEFDTPSRSSWHSDRPGTPRGLRERVMRPIDPTRQTYEEYVQLLDRQVAALEAFDQFVPSKTVDVLKEKSKILHEKHVRQTTEQEFVRGLKGKHLHRVITDYGREYGEMTDTDLAVEEL